MGKVKAWAMDHDEDFYDAQMNKMFWKGPKDTRWGLPMGKDEYAELTAGCVAQTEEYEEEGHYKEEEYKQMTKDCNEITARFLDNNPKTAAAASKPKMSDVPPVALFAVGAAMSDGATKYGRFNWRDTSVTSSVFYDAIIRHLVDWYNGEDFAHDSHVHHLGHIMASCAILLDGERHGVLNDDRNKSKSESIARNPTWKTNV